MKKVYLIISFIVFLLSGCSNSQNQIAYIPEEETLRSMINEKENSVLWTHELEGTRLLIPFSSNDMIDVSLHLSPGAYKTSKINYRNIYPSFSDFGSLDDSSLSSEMLSFIEKFVKSLSKDLYSVDSYFSSDTIFSLVFFVNDLKNDWKTIFNEEFPVVEKSAEESEKKTVDDEELYVYFNNYYVGNVYHTETEIQFSLRLINKNNYIDSVLYLDPAKKLFTQIEISGWGNL